MYHWQEKALTISNAPLNAAAIIEEEFEDLLTFPSIREIKRNG